MKDKILVSIIIPTYQNSLNLIDIPLESIYKQTCSKNLYEVIISNNYWAKGFLLKRRFKNSRLTQSLLKFMVSLRRFVIKLMLVLRLQRENIF